MTSRFPTDNLPPNMQPWRRAMENTLHIAESAQENSEAIIRSARQSVASNYGLGERLVSGAGSLSGKVYSQLANMQSSPASSVALQRSWTNVDGTLTLTTPAFVSNVSLSIANAYDFAVSGGSTGGIYYIWPRIQVTGAISATRYMSRENYGQVLVTAEAVPASSNITIRVQTWGYIKNTNGTFVNGTLGTASVVRLSAALRAVALV